MPTMTAAQRRARDRDVYNAYVAECPSRQVLLQAGLDKRGYA